MSKKVKNKITRHWKPLVIHVRSQHGTIVAGYDIAERDIFQQQLESYRSSRKLVAAFDRNEQIY